MTWNEYYSRFYDWAESTQINRISDISSFGDSSEIYEIADALLDEKAATRLIKKALSFGVKFSTVEIKELFDRVSADLYSELIKANKDAYTVDDIDYFYGIVDDEILVSVARSNHIKYRLPSEPEHNEKNSRKPGFFSSLLELRGNGGRTEHRYNGKCNGDCANCPPHYGYRYGRWYYGHNHVHGCEFGGNKGGGTKD